MPPSRGRPGNRQSKPDAKKPTSQQSESKQSAPPASQPSKTSQGSAAVGKSHYSLGKIVGLTRSTIPGIVTWAATVLTLVSGVIIFFPRVTVDPSGAYDPSSPSPITFTVANANVVPLRDVHIGTGICYIGSADNRNPRHEHCNGPFVANIIYHPQWFLQWLDVDEKSQVAVEDVLKRVDSQKQFEDADITIVIDYTPWYFPSWPFRQTRQFRFITLRRSDGKTYWTPVPLNR